MPPLLKSASLKPDVQITDAEEEAAEEDDEIEVLEVGDKRISIRTSVLEEKATACNMVGLLPVSSTSFSSCSSSSSSSSYLTSSSSPSA
jgi:hypothetical protein